jgi:hypothetical protein
MLEGSFGALLMLIGGLGAMALAPLAVVLTIIAYAGDIKGLKKACPWVWGLCVLALLFCVAMFILRALSAALFVPA